jgi:hypothetical protein
MHQWLPVPGRVNHARQINTLNYNLQVRSAYRFRIQVTSTSYYRFLGNISLQIQNSGHVCLIIQASGHISRQMQTSTQTNQQNKCVTLYVTSRRNSESDPFTSTYNTRAWYCPPYRLSEVMFNLSRLCFDPMAIMLDPCEHEDRPPYKPS